MRIWVDADACPNAIKTILFRAAQRTKITTTLVANHWCQLPSSPFIKRIQVSQGFDKADDEIEQQATAGDLVITADIPLADAVIKLGALVLTPRGNSYNKSNIKQALAMRDFNQSLRDSGMLSGGDAKMSQKDNNQFANQLDKILAKSMQNK